jgi:FAD/FMN-containing dehydrogenase
VSSTNVSAFESGDLTAATGKLAEQVHGPVLTPGDKGYDDETAGYQTIAKRAPQVVVGATGQDDVRSAVAFAVARSLPVAVQGTGHGLAPMEGGLLITTRRMTGVSIDAEARTARIEAGATWAQVVELASPYGLAPLSGSAPGVCAVSYLLGGGLGIMARQYGYGADHVLAINVVTADGALRHVTAEEDPDLFWALRGGQGNFGVATDVEVELMPVEKIYGGGLFFDAAQAEDVINTWQQWCDTVPEEMTSSLAMVPFPDIPVLPPPLRGKHVVHIRIAYIGDAESGEKLIKPLRAIGPTIMEGVREMPYSDSGTISNDPTDPAPYIASNAMLSGLDETAVSALLDVAGPGRSAVPLIAEFRQLGGALSRQPAVPNAVGHRDAAYAVGTLTILRSGDPDTAYAAHAELGKALAPWTVGRCLNFTYGSTTPEEVATAYDPADYRRLTELKARFDPDNVFRLNHNIPPTT